MGLKVHSLEGFPEDKTRDYYVYLLDYGWKEPLGKALRENFDHAASLSSRQKNSVVVMRSEGVEFNDEVLSWHGINGNKNPDLLPAILITNRHPSVFRRKEKLAMDEQKALKLVLLPLKKYCRTTSDVVSILQKVFESIKAGKSLDDFSITSKRKAGQRGAIVDEMIIAPVTGEQIALDIIQKFLQKDTAIRGVERAVLPIHFEDRSGEEFERLVLAYLTRKYQWKTLKWLGEAGKDAGRDIWGERENQTYCYQCANYRRLTTNKAFEDINKVIKYGTLPNNFVLVCGGLVGNLVRRRIEDHILGTGVNNAEIWTGREFEERLRTDTPDLIKRFVQGEAFPESVSDEVIIAKLTQSFDRPAFTTPFRQEVSIQDFEKAITDTIEVLNTGMKRLRDGTVIEKVQSRHDVNNPTLKTLLAQLTELVIMLRNDFKEYIKSGGIEPCKCGEKDCPVYLFSPDAIKDMDNRRTEILQLVKVLNPSSSLSIKH